MKRFFVIVLALLVATALFAGGAGEEASQQAPQQTAQEEDDFDARSGGLDPAIPESWFSAPRTASELGITSFNQSPMLDALVESGALPPVADRLPDDPPVIEPYGQVGTYGGTLTMFGTDLENELFGDDWEGLVQASADGTGYVPWFAERVELLEDATVVEITMREGLKWSDGTPFVAGDEYPFYWENLLDQLDPAAVNPPVTDVVRVSDNTVQIHLGLASPGYLQQHLNGTWFHHQMRAQPPAPMHVMRESLPQFIGEEGALRKARELDYQEIGQYILELSAQTYDQDDPRFNVPTMQAYRAVSRTETELVLERNPYYPFIDTEGNQLPYIDRIVIRFASSGENVALQAMSGASDVLSSSANSGEIPIYIQNEEQGDYTTYIHMNAALSMPFYSFNPTPPEESAEYAEYYRMPEFRQALSLAMNRDEINDRFYFGFGRPRQITVPPEHPLFREEWENAYAEFDPDRAREMLDEIGLIDRNGDGLRDFPNGDPFRMKLMWADQPYLADVRLHEYVVSNWLDVGIACDIQTVAVNTFWPRSGAAQWDIKMHLADASMPNPQGTVLMVLSPLDPPNVHGFGNWATYFRSGGEEGERPPEEYFAEVEALFNAGRRYMSTYDEEALEFMLESQAENLWSLGTVGFVPQAVLVANRIQNVPRRVYWDFSLGRARQLRWQQWYIDEE